MTAPSDLKGLMKTMGEVASFVEANNGICLIADIIPRLSNGHGIHYANSRLAKNTNSAIFSWQVASSGTIYAMEFS